MQAIEDGQVRLDPLSKRTVGIIGYGNQGRAQALNLRDSGIEVILGSVRDAGAERAEEDGFTVNSIEEACDEADVLALADVPELRFATGRLPVTSEARLTDVIRTSSVRLTEPSFRSAMIYPLCANPNFDVQFLITIE